MKKLTMLLASVLGLGLLTPTTAEAGHRTRCYTDDCGYTVYSEYRCVGYDCHGCPVYRWVIVRREAPCHSHGGYSGYDGGYGYGGGYGGGYRGSYSGNSHCDSGIHFQWSR